jgi:hypothetical protein
VHWSPVPGEKMPLETWYFGINKRTDIFLWS